jgi:hypothetical protein
LGAREDGAPVDFLVERMTRQGLSGRGTGSAATVASSAVGLQAQDPGSSRLGIRARSVAVDEAAVLDAIQVRRSVVRSWFMRSTVHLVAAEDANWLTALFGPMIERRFIGARWGPLGITAEVIDKAIPLTYKVLSGRQLTRHELAAELADRGVTLAADQQAATHLLLALSARGVTCRGPEQGRDATFALLEEWVPAGTSPVDPMAELARRYFHAFGPATGADFTTWSGLPSGAAITAIRDELTEVEFDGRRGWSLGTIEPVAGLALLPMFDNYLVGYRDRTAMLDPTRHKQVYVGGIIKATVVDNGRILASWQLSRGAKRSTITVTPFESLTRRQRRELDRECSDLARFLDEPLELAVAE